MFIFYLNINYICWANEALRCAAERETNRKEKKKVAEAKQIDETLMMMMTEEILEIIFHLCSSEGMTTTDDNCIRAHEKLVLFSNETNRTFWNRSAECVRRILFVSAFNYNNIHHEWKYVVSFTAAWHWKGLRCTNRADASYTCAYDHSSTDDAQEEWAWNGIFKKKKKMEKNGRD